MAFTMSAHEECWTERRGYNLQVNRSSPLLCQDLSQCWLDKIRKAYSNKKWPLSEERWIYIIALMSRQDNSRS